MQTKIPRALGLSIMSRNDYGLGGLNWRDVRPMIEKSFSELLDVRVLLFPPLGTPDARVEGGLKIV